MNNCYLWSGIIFQFLKSVRQSVILISVYVSWVSWFAWVDKIFHLGTGTVTTTRLVLWITEVKPERQFERRENNVNTAESANTTPHHGDCAVVENIINVAAQSPHQSWSGECPCSVQTRHFAFLFGIYPPSLTLLRSSWSRSSFCLDSVSTCFNLFSACSYASLVWCKST